MFSNTQEARFTGDTDNGSAVKNCQLCFSECDGVNGSIYNDNRKILDLCFKYLHSSLTQELPNGSAVEPFCAKCYGSAMELVTFSDQMEFIQRSISDMVFMFSLKILHRRGKASENTETIGKQLIEFDVSGLPNCDAWNNLTTVFNSHVSPLPQKIKSENISIENSENEEHFPDFTINNVNNVDLDSQINNGNLVENNSEMCIEEGAIFNEQATFASNSPYVTDSELLIEHKVLTNAEIESSTSASVATSLGTPTIHLSKLQIHGGATRVTADKDPLKKRAKKPVGAESDCVNKRRSVRQRLAKPSNEQCGGKLKSLLLNRNTTRSSSKSTNPLRRRLRSQNVSKANQRVQRKGMPQRASVYKKRIKPQCRMIADKKSRNDEEKFQCVFCPEYFNSSILLSTHHRQHRKEGAQLKCTYCPKVFSRTTHCVSHIRTHTGEKPFRCEKCDYASARLSYLHEHQIRRHGRHAASFNCRECGHKFKIQDDVKRHYKRLHPALEYSKDCVIVAN